VKEALGLLWQAWNTLWGMPWWVHVLFTIPFVGFLVFQFIKLFSGIFGGISWSMEKPKKEKEVDIDGIPTMVIASVVVGDLLGSLVKEKGVPNQLIQKKGKTPIAKVTIEQPIDLSSTETRLRESFERIKSKKGLSYLSKLEIEYKGLQSLLSGKKIEDTVLNLGRISKLTSDLYQNGLNFLLKSLSISEQLGTSSREDLLAESEELKSELNRCTPSLTPESRHRLKSAGAPKDKYKEGASY